MCDQWMPVVRLNISIDEFHQLPRNPSYKYEYYGGRAVLSPRANHFHAILDLASYQPVLADANDFVIRPLERKDREHLPHAFAWAFERIQPYGSLKDEARLDAARASLEKTWTGGDGFWLEEASLVVADVASERAVGSLLITLLPGGDPTDFDSFAWPQPEPPAEIMKQTGQPHLTWIFVAPLYAGQGVGTALLAAAVSRLRELGYGSLWSTFVSGNESSLLWHWRNGFWLQSSPLSKRVMKQKWAKWTPPAP